MSETATIDEKGRLLIPKKIRDTAVILAPVQAVIRVKGPAHIELIAVDPSMKRSREVARKKLSGWREEEHEADRLASRLFVKGE